MGTFTSPTALLEMMAKYITNKETSLKLYIITKDILDGCEIRKLVCLNFKKMFMAEHFKRTDGIAQHVILVKKLLYDKVLAEIREWMMSIIAKSLKKQTT